MEFLEQLYGLGPGLAKQLYKRLIQENLITASSSPGDIWTALRHPAIFPDLPIATRIDLVERPDKLIPHEVIQVLDRVLRSRVDRIKFDIAGSYRRRKPISRDVDLVMSRGSWKTSLSVWKSFIKQIHGNRYVKFHSPFAGGDNKLSVLVDVFVSSAVVRSITNSHPDIHAKRKWKLKVDVFCTPPLEYMFMLLYATGSGQFNIMMRAQAKRHGYMLNQKGLFLRSSGKRVSVKNEKELFNILKIGFRKPENRT